jgi:hypothetical protein
MSGIPGGLPPASRLGVCKASEKYVARKSFMLDEGGIGRAIVHAAQATVDRCHEGVNLKGVTIRVRGRVEPTDNSKGQKPTEVKVTISGITDAKAKAEVEKLLKATFTDKCRFDGSGTTFEGEVSI